MTQASEQTVWQAMQGRTNDLFMANALLPCFIAFLYGIYQFYDQGASVDHYGHTYIPLFGSIIAGVCIITFSISSLRLALIPPRIFALYVLCILGGIGVASSSWPTLNLLPIVIGAIWTFLGWKMFRRLGIASDLARTPIDTPNLKEHLVSHVGLKRRDMWKLANDENLATRFETGSS